MNEVEQGGTNLGLIAVKRAAQLLAVSPRTVWRMIADGRFKVVHVRGCTRLLLVEVMAYQQQNG